MTILDFEHQVADFIELVHRRDHLRQEFSRVYDAIDDWGDALDADAFQIVLNNVRTYLDELAAELDVAEQTTSALLPQMKAYLESESEPPCTVELEGDPPAEFPSGMDGVSSDAQAPPVPSETEQLYSEEAAAASFDDDVPEDGTADTVAPDSPFPFDDLPEESEDYDAAMPFDALPEELDEPALDDIAAGEDEMLFWLNDKNARGDARPAVRNTLDGMGHPAELSSREEADDEITQIFDKGGLG